ncbi:MAG: hypothetical protein WD011_03590 [Nitriliruptoraceae bacterium]
MTIGDDWRALLAGTTSPDPRAAQRGQGLFRRGGVRDVTVMRGQIRATVVDGPDERVCTLQWPPIDPERASRAQALLAGQVRFTAALLERTVTDDLASALADLDVAVVPTFAELSWTCCDNRWCRHVAAVHAAAAAEFDRDPRGVLTLRGIDHERVLARVGRGGGGAPAPTFDTDADPLRAVGNLAEIVLRPTPPRDPAALLEHLGPPPGVDHIEELAQLVAGAAAAAWRLAAGDGAAAADEELLLAELRGQRVATARSLADALGADEDDIREQLDRLYDAGAVLRTGADGAAKYRAAAR